MNIKEAIHMRHSVRQYTDKPLALDIIATLNEEINNCNRESGLHIQLIVDEPKAFRSFMAHYGKFSGVTNYIALIGKAGTGFEEKCGYYGERLVLKAQRLGLNTCWVAMTYRKIKTAFKIKKGEKLCVVIALGYGKTQGIAHKSKPQETVMNVEKPVPEWFQNGIEAALLAPTAMNQQKFLFTLKGTQVAAKAKPGFYSNVDLGIVKYHFEIGAGTENFEWV